VSAAAPAATPAPAKTAATSAAGAPATLPASVAGVRPPTDLKGSPSSAAVDIAKGPTAGQRVLHFRFDKDSWVEIRDRNDKVIFSKLNKAGSEERVNGSPPLKLVVGNARSVRLDSDEKPVDLAPHIGVTVARLTLQ
jgi:cytoskeleton protein RodZ